MKSIKKRINAVFKNSKADAIVLFNTDREDSNFSYLTGFGSGTFEYTPLIIQREGLTLFVSELEYGIAKMERPKEMELKAMDRKSDLKKELAKILKGKRVGINGRFLPYGLYKFLEGLRPRPKRIIDAGNALALARIVKDAEEIKSVGRAVSTTKMAIEKTKAELREGLSEREVATMIDANIVRAGAKNAFDSIVAFDSNTALPHHSPGNKRLGKNSMVLFDVGARHNGYCGDITRTFMFKPDKKSERYRRFSEMYGVVSRAQKLALSAIKEGAAGNTPHNRAENYINAYNKGAYKGRFIHSLGHSIGMDVHDGPYGLSPGSKIRLKQGMVFSDEPGIYIEGFGGVRIEDDVLVGKSSSRFL
jgi:Xaa-Pro dipeptidase